MMFFYYIGKIHPRTFPAHLIPLVLAIQSALSACSSDQRAPSSTGALRILVEQEPLTLNPRSAMDAAGQRIGALMFRGLTRLNADLNAEPDLAESWKVEKEGLSWSFIIRPDLRDHGGETIDAGKMAACLEQYRSGKPFSPLVAGFPSWRSTKVEKRGARDAVVVQLGKPDPYLSKNLSLLRYFRVEGSPTPCSDPAPGAAVIASGKYRSARWDANPRHELRIDPVSAGLPPLHFSFIRDDATRAMKLLRGEIDVVQNALSLAKSRWVQREHGDRFEIHERDGVNVSYLAFNMSDPVLAKKEVRQAIALAISREQIVQHKFFGFGTVAGSLLSPLLPESSQTSFHFDPARAEALLEKAGYPRGKDGVRLRLKYKANTYRESLEIALVIQEMLRKIGIELRLEVLEPAVYLAAVRKGNFQVHASRWVGISDGSILYRTLHSRQPGNRARYSNPAMDALLEQAMSETDDRRRTRVWKQVQKLAAEDLPYFPLWYWNNAVILRKELAPGLNASKISLSGAYEPLVHMLKLESR